MKSISLRERVRQLKRQYDINICAFTLRKIYLSHGIRYKTCDLHFTNKFVQRTAIKEEQLKFVTEHKVREASRYIVFIDETSMNVWGGLKKKSWTDNRSVVLPLQSSRGISKTIIGAIGCYMNRPAE